VHDFANLARLHHDDLAAALVRGRGEQAPYLIEIQAD
jgi:hypothetical protein